MKIDVSILSFILVLLIAIPVTALRSGTYAIGYEIADLKSRERVLYETNLALKADLAVTQTRVYDHHITQMNQSQEIAHPGSASRDADQRPIAYPPSGFVSEAAPQP